MVEKLLVEDVEGLLSEEENGFDLMEMLNLEFVEGNTPLEGAIATDSGMETGNDRDSFDLGSYIESAVRESTKEKDLEGSTELEEMTSTKEVTTTTKEEEVKLDMKPPILKKKKSNPFYSPSLKVQKLVQRKNKKYGVAIDGTLNDKEANRSPLLQRSVNILQTNLSKDEHAHSLL